jgi:hypothetical protein
MDKNYSLSWARWLTPVISATWEVQIRRKIHEASLGRKFARPYLNQ